MRKADGRDLSTRHVAPSTPEQRQARGMYLTEVRHDSLVGFSMFQYVTLVATLPRCIPLGAVSGAPHALSSPTLTGSPANHRMIHLPVAPLLYRNGNRFPF